jgi:hypothetical protein
MISIPIHIFQKYPLKIDVKIPDNPTVDTLREKTKMSIRELYDWLDSYRSLIFEKRNSVITDLSVQYVTDRSDISFRKEQQKRTGGIGTGNVTSTNFTLFVHRNVEIN